VSNSYTPVNPGAFTPQASPPSPFGSPSSGLSSSSFTAAVPATGPAAGADVNALYGALHMFSWREVGFPVTEFEQDFRRDLVIHKFADMDGAHVEDTGRHPLQITAHVPFVNGLRKGPSETWSDPLYPYTWRLLLAACAQKGSGTLVHPELGPLTCKLESFRTTWSGTARGGPMGILVWIESDDVGLDLDQDLSTPSPLASIAGAASDADADLASIDPSIVPKLPTFSSSFTDMTNALLAVIDLPSLLANQYGGQLENVIWNAQRLESALSTAPNRSALNWPLFLAAEQMKSAAYDLQQTLLTKGRQVGLYTVQGDQTLSQVAANLNANLADIMTLNPSLVQNPLILDQTQVRYYLPSA
jgi:hypothetical protein